MRAWSRQPPALCAATCELRPALDAEHGEHPPMPARTCRDRARSLALPPSARYDKGGTDEEVDCGRAVRAVRRPPTRSRAEAPKGGRERREAMMER